MTVEQTDPYLKYYVYSVTIISTLINGAYIKYKNVYVGTGEDSGPKSSITVFACVT